jgi:hypothetical protein
MKAKLAILILAVVCLWGQTAHADTVVDLSAILCSVCPPPNGFSTIDLEAQLTVEAANGTWLDAGQAAFFTGTVLEVKAITGTLNGNPISFFPAPAGDGSWLKPATLRPGFVTFSADGFMFWLADEGDSISINYTQPNGLGTSSADVNITTTVVSTPEPSSLLLLIVGLLAAGIAFLRFSPFSLASRADANHALCT